MLHSIRSQSSYRLLRIFIDLVAGLSILFTVITGIAAMERNALLGLWTMAVGVVTSIAGRMFAHLIVDIADTLQWQSRRMAEEDANSANDDAASSPTPQ